jgi:type III restriction enzyme
MKSDLDIATTLLQKADNDLKIARIGIEHDGPLDAVAFHVQQAAEKLARSKELGAARAAAAAGGAAPAAGLAGTQPSLFPSAEETAVPVDADKIARELRERIEQEVDALALQIDIPDIRTYTDPKLGFTTFEPKPSSDFDLVEQRVRSADLMTAEQETGEALTLEEIERPVAYLAATLFDEVEEFDAVEDKDRALKLASDYLTALGKPEEELGRLVHQYGHSIVKDLAEQVYAHIYDDTKVTHEVRADFIVFKTFSKSIREKDGEINLREPLDNKSQIRRFLFSGIKKSIINRTGFDSDPERRCAIALEDDTEVLKWVRPPANQMPIYSRGSTYNVDFVAETATNRYLIEVKARDELGTDDTKEKARAANGWCQVATATKGGKPWSYAIIPDDAVSPTSSLAHLLAQAVNVLGR